MSFSWITSAIASYINKDESDDTLSIEIDDTSIAQETESSSSKSSNIKSKSKSNKKKSKSSSTSIQGLENLGNTCFFNASVQALLACPKFVQYITVLSKKQKENTAHSKYTPYQPSTPYEPSTANEDDNTDKIFCQLLLDLYEGTITSPEELFGILCAFHPTEFHQFTQSDAHESFNKMMEILEIEQLYISTESQSDNIINDMFEFLNDEGGEEKEGEEEEEAEEEEKTINNGRDLDITKIKNPFNGLLGSTLECTKCKFENESRQTSFTCLTLSLIDDIENINNGFQTLYTHKAVKLRNRIAAFEIEEEIEGYRCMFCETKGVLDEIKHTLTVKYFLENSDYHLIFITKIKQSLRKQKDPEQGNPRSQLNETQMIVLQDQYQELHETLNKLMPNQYGNNKLQNGNGYKYLNGNSNSKNGYHHNHNNVIITTKQKEKYRIDVSLIKSYRTTAKKKQFVSRYPNVLCIHLNRLQFGSKDGRFVSFEQILSLNDNKMNNNNKNSDIIMNIFNQYILMAVIVHHGNDSGGHYTTYKRKVNLPNKLSSSSSISLEWKSKEELEIIRKYSEWYHISDEFVNKVGIHQVLMCQAYMLFYQKNQICFKK